MVSGQRGQTGRYVTIPVVKDCQLELVIVQTLSRNMVDILVMDLLMNLPSAQKTKASQSVTTLVY